jgi:acyl-CoA thioesterase FadM
VTVGLRHTDVDVQKAVHSVALADIFEEARTRYSIARRLKPAFDPHRRLLRSVTIESFRDATYPGSLEVGIGIVSVGEHDWVVDLLAVQSGIAVARCLTRFSLAQGDAPAALPDGLIALLRSDLHSKDPLLG